MTIDALYYRVISKDREFYLVPLYLILRLASVFYSAILCARFFLYRAGILKTRRLKCRVISVGNLTLGGVGKTPAVMMIAELLRQKGFKPAIISRGYKGKMEGKTGVVSDGQKVLLTAEVAGDEPVMMARRLQNVPIIVGRNRYRAGKLAQEKFGADTLVLDDAFQHLALHRDLNILLCDEERPFGNGVVFPAGDLREPGSQCRRADLIALTRCSATQTPGRQTPEAIEELELASAPVVKTALRLESFHRADTDATMQPESLRGKKVAAFCGIGRPDDFIKTLETAGAKVVCQKAFPDHHRFSAGDINSLEGQAKANGAQFFVTTEKDAVKLEGLTFSLPLLVARIGIIFLEGEEIFERLISAQAE